MPKNFYITTTLPYVNSDPHVGFALEVVQADVIARYKRSCGYDVFFNTGTDEHGQKIFEASKKVGKDVKDYVDHYASEFAKLKDLLGISNDVFVRTTDPHHAIAAAEIWSKCNKSGDIELREYSGKYCVGCESYKSERDLDSKGQCVLHPNNELITLHEKNYFFKFSKYQEKLLAYLNKPESVVPEWKRQEAINFVKAGLEDFSISRQRGQLEWGIPVPGDENQVMYVWFDALTNYISTLGWPEDKEGKFKKYWEGGQVLQCAGKDQVRFQSLMWQAMLFSAGIKNTDTVIYHGFINSGGQKMSKSIGNVISPKDVVEQYGTDALRYFLTREISTFDDSDFTMDRFKELYNANLANGLGNLVSRVMKMAETNLKSPVVVSEKDIPQEFSDLLEKFEIQKATDLIWQKVAEADKYIQETQPFKLIKTDKEKGEAIIVDLVNRVKVIADMLSIVMPSTAEKILSLIKENKAPTVPLFARKD